MCKMVCLSVSASVNENAALLAFEARGRVGPSLPFPFGSVHAAKRSRRRRLTKVDLIMTPCSNGSWFSNANGVRPSFCGCHEKKML